MSKDVRMPAISFIVARSYPDNIIGCENELPWSLKTDLKRFREITTGHVVVMGRKTFESIGRPLPNRTSIVLSKNVHNDQSAVFWVQSIHTAILMADFYSIIRDKREYFIIGGADIYRKFEQYFSKVYLTEVFSSNIEGDAFFEFDFRGDDDFKTHNEIEVPKSDEDQYPSRFSVLTRKVTRPRYRNKSEFKTDFDPAQLERLKDTIEKSEYFSKGEEGSEGSKQYEMREFDPSEFA